jgi:DNA-binding MarR family transcriptional regulator
MKQSPSVDEVILPTSSRVLQSYLDAFPDADISMLAAHLAVTHTGAMVTRGIEARIQDLGFDLSRPRYTIIRSLYLSPEGVLAQSDLAHILRVSGPNITQLIDGLAAEGWVERVVSPLDRRVVHARLTSEGRQRAARLVPAILEFMEDSCRTLSQDERHELQRLLEKVRLSVETSATV